jgi:hypothetical protein
VVARRDGGVGREHIGRYGVLGFTVARWLFRGQIDGYGASPPPAGISRAVIVGAATRGRRGADPRSRSDLSKAESERERLLLRRLDRPRAVVGTNPSDRFRGREADEDRQAREGPTGPSVTTDAAEFDAFAGSSHLEHRDKRVPGSIWLSRDAKVGPVEMVVGPRRLPPRVQVEPVIGRFITPIRVGRVKGTGTNSVPSGSAITDQWRWRCSSRSRCS